MHAQHTGGHGRCAAGGRLRSALTPLRARPCARLPRSPKHLSLWERYVLGWHKQYNPVADAKLREQEEASDGLKAVSPLSPESKTTPTSPLSKVEVLPSAKSQKVRACTAPPEHAACGMQAGALVHTAARALHR